MLDDFEITFLLISVQTVLVLGLVIISIILGRKILSKTAELTAAVDRAIQVIQNPPVPQDMTPDSEVQTQVDKLNAALPAQG